MFVINSDYSIPKPEPEEIWRSLGWKNQEVSDELLKKTKDMAGLAQETARPKSTLLEGNLDRKDEKLFFYNIELEGKALPRFLENAETAALMAVTLGTQLDRRIKALEPADLSSAVLLDAAASILVEKVCDEQTRRFEEAKKQEGRFITERFSPGYADCPLNLQPELLRLLDAPRKLGLTCSDSHLLFPRKSVTAFIGVMDEPRKPKFDRCAHCRLRKECRYGICAFEK